MADKKSKSEGSEKSVKKEAAAPVPFMGYPSLDTMRGEMERMMQRFFSNDWLGGMPRFPAMGEWPPVGRF